MKQTLEQALEGMSLGILSASRPGEDNEERSYRLLQDIRQYYKGCPYALKAIWQDIPEYGFLLPRVNSSLVFALGNKYGQDCVIFKGNDGIAGLYSDRHVILANNPENLTLLMRDGQFDFDQNKDRPLPWDGVNPMTRDKVLKTDWCRPRTLRARLLARYPSLAKVAAPTTNWKRVVAVDSKGYPITGYLRNQGTPLSQLLKAPVELRNVNEYGGRSGKGRIVAVVSTVDGRPPHPSLPAPRRDLVSTFRKVKQGDEIMLFPESDVAFKVTNVSSNELNFKTRSLAEGQILITKEYPDLVLLTQGSRTVPLRRLEIKH